MVVAHPGDRTIPTVPVEYRPEIDGLRAIAVIAVLFYHAGFSVAAGGYVGVDVFFVISGYLITQFINVRIARNEFSIVDFYERRVRRIIPALFLMMIFVSTAAYELFLPSALEEFAASVFATSVFSSNLLFWHQAGYFDGPSVLKPLLHTWSLAVEEQFYIVFPLFMFAATKWLRRYIGCLVVLILVLSFGASVWAVEHARSAAFFLAPSRAWELLLGSVLALGLVPRLGNQAFRNALSGMGIVAILSSVILFKTSTPFPGVAAVLPCLGAAFIIYADLNTPTVVGAFLSLRPIVGIGKISYSLYLWHWPLIVFARYVLFRPLSQAEIWLVIAASCLCAAVSWKFVEQPFRRHGGVFPRAPLFAATLGLIVLVSMAGLLVISENGLPSRVSHQVTAYDAARSDRDPRTEECLLSMSPERVRQGNLCVLGPVGRPSFIVWGDSHAGAIMPIIHALAAKAQVTGWFAAYEGCPPLLRVTRSSEPNRRCDEFNNAVLALIERNDIHSILLVARWSVGAMGRTRYELESGRNQVFIKDDATQQLSLDENWRVFQRGITRTLTKLEGRHVDIVLEAPNPDLPVPEFLARGANLGRIGSEARIDIDTEEDAKKIVHLFEGVRATFGTKIIDPTIAMCDGSHRCIIAADGRSLYIDDNHLSTAGAMRLVDVFRPIFNRIESEAGASDPR